MVEYFRVKRSHLIVRYQVSLYYILLLCPFVMSQDRQDLEALKPLVALRPSAQLYHNYTSYKRAQSAGVRAVTIGRFVAFFIKYNDNTPLSKQKSFWLGKVIRVSDDDIAVHYFHGAYTRGADCKRTTFRIWTGPNPTVKVNRAAIIDVFDALSSGGRIPAANRKFIVARAKTGMLSEHSDVGVGKHAENHEESGEDNDEDFELSGRSGGDVTGEEE
jgi:hypothetical protein